MADKSQSSDAESLPEPLTPVAWNLIQDALRGLRFGQVLLVVHEGAIVQVDRTERKRISNV
ncbi:MAG TPA: YezD family protein [Planctomycetaceae bacterium]|nr:YezD family protein [Planctomycetaceae bacterium]